MHAEERELKESVPKSVLTSLSLIFSSILVSLFVLLHDGNRFLFFRKRAEERERAKQPCSRKRAELFANLCVWWGLSREIAPFWPPLEPILDLSTERNKEECSIALLRRLHVQGKKKASHSRQIGSEWDVESPRGGMEEAGAHQPKSVKCRWRVENNFSMYNAWLFSSDAHCGDQCENIDKERRRGTSRYWRRNESSSRHLEMRSTSWIYRCGTNVCARVQGLKNASHDNRHSSPQPVVINTYGWYCTLKINLSENKMDKWDVRWLREMSWHDVKKNPTNTKCAPDNIVSWVEQVTVRQRKKIVRHGNPERKDPWTRETSREWQNNQWEKTKWRNMTLHKKCDFWWGPVLPNDLKKLEVQIVFLLSHKKYFLDCDEITKVGNAHSQASPCSPGNGIANMTGRVLGNSSQKNTLAEKTPRKQHCISDRTLERAHVYLNNFWLDQIVVSKNLKPVLMLRSTVVLC